MAYLTTIVQTPIDVNLRKVNHVEVIHKDGKRLEPVEPCVLVAKTVPDPKVSKQMQV